MGTRARLLFSQKTRVATPAEADIARNTNGKTDPTIRDKPTGGFVSLITTIQFRRLR